VAATLVTMTLTSPSFSPQVPPRNAYPTPSLNKRWLVFVKGLFDMIKSATVFSGLKRSQFFSVITKAYSNT